MNWNKTYHIDSDLVKYHEDCKSGAPIHSFSGLKNLLSSLGFDVGDADGYKAIDVTDISVEELRNGAIEFTDNGIFVTTNNVRHQIFLYRRDYHLELYGKPRFHIVKCQTIRSFINNYSMTAYRRANTATVLVHDMDDDMDTEVDDLPLCKFCLKIAPQAFPDMTTSDFVELLKESEPPELNKPRMKVARRKW